jgi:hypothetical protein
LIRDGGECPRCRAHRLSRLRHEAERSARVAPTIVHDVLGRPGAPLARGVTTAASERFGQDFSHVRVHTDAEAARSAGAVSASAYTVGSHVVFGPDRFAPNTASGRRLLWHELTHVVQQADADASSGGPIPIAGHDTAERQAREVGHGVAPPEAAGSGRATPASRSLQRQGLDDEDKIRQSLGFEPKPKSQGVHWIGGRPDWVHGDENTNVSWLGSPPTPALKSAVDYEFQQPPAAVPAARSAAAPTKPPTRPALVKPAAKLAPTTGAPAAAGGKGGGSITVKVLSDEEYEAASGRSADSLPEGTMVSPVVAGLAPAMVTTPPPPLPYGPNTTGVLWEGHHAVDFASSGGDVTMRGFRAPFMTHVRSTIGRTFLPSGGAATRALNRGIPGSYANDWFYQYMPGATLVSRNAARPGAAKEFAETIDRSVPRFAGEQYRFSPPPVGHPAYDAAFGSGEFCPLGGQNCINLPRDIHEQGLGGKHLELGTQGGPFDISTAEGTYPGAADKVPKAASAQAMDEWIGQSDEWFAARDLTRTKIGPTMLARGASGVIRGGGYVLLIYGAYKTTERLAGATPEEMPVVVGEEAGSWGGGWVGNVLASALGGAFVCSESGPGAFVCALGFGIAGGVTGSVVGKDIGHDVGEAVKTLEKAKPQDLIEGSVQMFGTPEERKQYYENQQLLEDLGM